jgi:membrane-associated phospholipid phosphatase
MTTIMRPRAIAHLWIASVSIFANCYAQQPPVREEPGIVAAGKQFLREEADLWTSPLRINSEDLKWIVPLGAGTAALLQTDRTISTRIAQNHGIQPPSNVVSQLGSFPLYLTPAALMVLGRATKDERAAQAGRVTLQAVLHSGIIVQTLKASTNRQRPSNGLGGGGFWDGGKSFPSGHAMSSWAFATALSDQYPEKKWIRISAYGMATAVSVSRISGRNHFPSDVLIGSSLGWLIGHYVSHRH